MHYSQNDLVSLAYVERARLMPVVMLGGHAKRILIGCERKVWGLLPKVAWPRGANLRLTALG